MAETSRNQLTLHEVAGDELTPAQLYGILRLRVDVFVVEQECPYPEIDGRDLLPATRHLWVTGADGIGSYLRVLEEARGTRRIGRVCTSSQAREQGLAAHLMTAALAYTGDEDCVLDAQAYAQGFYAKFGFEREGEEFVEDGIPHITMWRRPLTRSGRA